MRGRAQRHSLPQPGEVKERDELVPRPRSFWFKPQKHPWDEFESIPRDWSEPLPMTPMRGNSWRDSVTSVTSNGISTSSLHEPRSRSSIWRSSDRFSNGSSSSIFTRFSGSTTSTSLTAPSSGTTSKRSSRGSVFQREKRISNVKSGLYAISLLSDTNSKSWLYQ